MEKKLFLIVIIATIFNESHRSYHYSNSYSEFRKQYYDECKQRIRKEREKTEYNQKKECERQRIEHDKLMKQCRETDLVTLEKDLKEFGELTVKKFPILNALPRELIGASAIAIFMGSLTFITFQIVKRIL